MGLHMMIRPSVRPEEQWHCLPVVMPEHLDARALKGPASPVRGLDFPVKEMKAIKTDHEILVTAMQDIGIIKAALSSQAPAEMLDSAPDLILAYKDFMHKGRVEKGKQRRWEYRPASKEFKEGLHRFSLMLNELCDLDLNSDISHWPAHGRQYSSAMWLYKGENERGSCYLTRVSAMYINHLLRYMICAAKAAPLMCVTLHLRQWSIV